MIRPRAFTVKPVMVLLVLSLLLGQSLVWAAPGPAQRGRRKTAPQRATTVATIAALQTRIRALLNVEIYRAAHWGVKIVALNSGRTIFEANADKLVMPASNMKLYTTAAGLDLLGADSRPRTSVYATAEPDASGTIRGDLILYGRGDPTLTLRTAAPNAQDSTPPPPALEQLAEQLVAKGVRRIEGQLVGDDSYFNSSPHGSGWEWDDLQWRYGAEISALTLTDNVVELTIAPGAMVGDAGTITLDPPNSYVTIVNQVSTVAAGAPLQLGIQRGLSNNVIEVWGALPVNTAGLKRSVSVHNPALFVASLFRAVLAERGIVVMGDTRSIDARAREREPLDLNQVTELAAVTSVPLLEDIRTINVDSNNLHAELLLRQLGVKLGHTLTATKANPNAGKPVSDEAGAAVVTEFLTRIGIETVALNIKDGSGLSRHNLITPSATVALLTYLARQPYGNEFILSLPRPGGPGTLRNRLGALPATADLRAKTGTISNVNALSGYVKTARGEPVVFSLIINNQTREVSAVRTIDAICQLLAEYTGKL